MHNRLTDELAVCGLNAVLALAEYNPDQINRFFLREDRLELFTDLCRELAERKRPYKFCENEELERICKSSHHQGVVAMIYLPKLESVSTEDLDDWAANGSTGLVLHSIGNDHNLGAIIRAAAFFDVKYIILAGNTAKAEADENYDGNFLPEDSFPEDRLSGARLSTSTYRVAAGAMEHVTVRTVRNTAAFLRDASRQIITIGTDIRARQRIEHLSRIVDEKKKGSGPPGLALVLGNEERGLPENVKGECSVLVRIPGTGLMESLNVSQAAALFMHRIFEL